MLRRISGRKLYGRSLVTDKFDVLNTSINAHIGRASPVNGRAIHNQIPLNHIFICFKFNPFSKISLIASISPSLVINLWSFVALITEPLSKVYSKISCLPRSCH
jgi:hypothetical protein